MTREMLGMGNVMLICDKNIVECPKNLLEPQKARRRRWGEQKMMCPDAPPSFFRSSNLRRGEGGGQQQGLLSQKTRFKTRKGGGREFLALGLARRLRIRTSLLGTFPLKRFFSLTCCLLFC